MSRRAGTRALLSWSGGKDSAYVLDTVRRAGAVEVVGLLTTITARTGRSCMHGVRGRLLERQAEAAGLPLITVKVSAGEDGPALYARRMEAVLAAARRTGVSSVVFGDIFLDEVRRTREARLAGVGMNALFPLWGRSTGTLARSFLERGFRAVITCVDGTALDGSFAGRAFDEAFLRDLPPGVDPCGERGEFHSFVHDGPVFRKAVAYRPGGVALREDRFHVHDLLAA